MAKLIALDVAILPPPDVSARAIEFSAALDGDDTPALRLDAEHLPHITLTQLFVREEEIDSAFEHVDGVVRALPPLRLTATDIGKEGHTLWLRVERTPELIALHEDLMEALRGLERAEGTPAAFFEHDARLADVLWVSGYRLKSSFSAFNPHLTLGHGTEAPPLEPFSFDATTVAACHLGRHCTCRRVLRGWSLQR